MTATTSTPARTPAGVSALPRDLPGLLLARITVLPALVALFFLLVAFPLLLIGEFKPVPVIVAAGLVIVVGVPLSLRRVRVPIRDTPLWAPIAIAVIAIGFFLFQLRYRSDFVIVSRDPASYMQFATWIAKHGSVPIPEDLPAFGSAQHLVEFGSFAYYQVGTAIVPQFMAGLPMVLGTAYWWGGTFTAMSMAPLLGGAGVLTFGGLAARLVGPRWAVPATLTLAVSYPEMFTSRSTYSEPLAQILLLGGICLFIDSQRASVVRTARTLAALAGLALGILLLVRLDGAADTLPILPWCGALLVARRPQAIPLLAGFAVGTVYGVVDGAFITLPYLKTNITSVRPLIALTVVIALATLVAVMGLRNGIRVARPRWLPAAAAALPPLVLAGAVGRLIIAPPYINKQDYAAHSLEWIVWWIGAPIVVAATIGASLLAFRVLRNRQPEWVLPLMIFGWAIVVFLARPAINPDMPWASRRLVPAVLPGCILLAAWAASWVTQQLKERGFAGPPAKLFAACCGIVLVAPPAWIAFQPHLGSAGMSLRGLAVQPTYHGELAALDKLCAAIPADATVLVIDGWTADRLLENIRGDCGVPAAGLADVTVSRVEQVISGIEATGRRAVVIGNSQKELSPYPDGTMTQVMALHTQFDAYDFNSVPKSTRNYWIFMWMWEQNR
jgi:hypothetical protein